MDETAQCNAVHAAQRTAPRMFLTWVRMDNLHGLRSTLEDTWLVKQDAFLGRLSKCDLKLAQIVHLTCSIEDHTHLIMLLNITSVVIWLSSVRGRTHLPRQLQMMKKDSQRQGARWQHTPTHRYASRTNRGAQRAGRKHQGREPPTLK